LASGGTTGYDFANQVLGLYRPAGERPMTQLYRRFANRGEFRRGALRQQETHHSSQLASEMNVLARELHGLRWDWRTGDFTLNGISRPSKRSSQPSRSTALMSARGASAEDRRYIEWALAQAKKRWRTADTSIFEFIHGC
jgi:(1->4)-alpha-D-glucan 1-alpha-D-glucosylmutase